MGRYRKKPVVIEAWLWRFDESQEAAPAWMTDALHRWPEPESASFEPDHEAGARIVITTLEGDMTAQPGDWIIRGVQGELYPCKPDIFEAMYESVE